MSALFISDREDLAAKNRWVELPITCSNVPRAQSSLSPEPAALAFPTDADICSSAATIQETIKTTSAPDRQIPSEESSSPAAGSFFIHDGIGGTDESSDGGLAHAN